MTTVVQTVARLLSHPCGRYVIAHQREDPEGGSVAFLDPHTLRSDYIGPKVFGIVRLTMDEIRFFSQTQILHRVREAEQKLLRDLGKSGGKALGSFGVSIFVSISVLWKVSTFIS